MADDSKATDVGARYAQALFDLAKDDKKIAAVEADLKSLKSMAAESKDLRTLLNSPGFSAEDKAAGLAGIAAKAKFNPLTVKFLAFLAAQRRANAASGKARAAAMQRTRMQSAMNDMVHRISRLGCAAEGDPAA